MKENDVSVSGEDAKGDTESGCCGLPALEFGSDVCADPGRALQLEWLETNGLGGYASSSIIGANTRRYHGLLVAALKPPVARFVLLSKIDETVDTPAGALELGSSIFPGAIHPHGYKNIELFALDPFPRWLFRAGDFLLEKTLLLRRGMDSVLIRYRWLDADMKPAGRAPDGFNLALRPFFAFRDYHQLTHRNDACDMTARAVDDGFRVSPYSSLPGVTANTGGGAFTAAPDWYHNFEYDRERERGLDFREDLFSPCLITSPAGAGEWTLAFGVTESDAASCPENDFEAAAATERARRAGLLDTLGTTDAATRRLALTADTFVARRGAGGRTVLAGYHWFTDWGRDTMISLPGIAIATKRYDIAKEILTTFAGLVESGLIPNTFPDHGEKPAYNTVDAPLWFVLACGACFDATGDIDFLKEIWAPVASVIDSYRTGTINKIYMDEDGLISAGGPYTQLTWMDAKVGDWVVTPRHGKAVEINALWYNCLTAMSKLAIRAGDDPARYADLAKLVKREFIKKFWNEDSGCLYDVVRPGEADASVRPNQVFALSLGGGLAPENKGESILGVIESRLLTPYGLRSLSPEGGECYHGRYEGGALERDGAYHRGTVWGWLMGPYISAVWNVRGRTRETMKYAARLLEGLDSHLAAAGLNSISEIFDGDAPHYPRGCISQAWSVAELLRVKLEMSEYGKR